MAALPPELSRPRRRWPAYVALAIAVVVVAGGWWWFAGRPQEAQGAKKGPNAVPVVTAKVDSRDVPVRLQANGTVVALQSVEIRPQVTSIVRTLHIREGQAVQAGDLLFTLDARADEANLKKSLAQVEKDRADLVTAQRNYERQRELFNQKFISQSALDVAQNQVDTLRGQLAVDQAASDAARVAVGYSEIRAMFAGRTGTISVRPGSLVQPGSAPMVTVTQVNPVQVSFTLPEKELAGLRNAMAAGPVEVRALQENSPTPLKGKLVFLDNAVDSATGTIRVKAEFDNDAARLWPGMYVNVELAPRMIAKASVVPVQAVQTGPDTRFIYEVGEDSKVISRIVKVPYLETGFAVVEGVAPGARIVIEGAQNVRPGTLVAEASRAPAESGEKSKGKGKAAQGS